MNIRKVVAVIVLNPEGKFLILKRSPDKKVHAGLWNVPSGGIEKGESAKGAAIREVYEETGFKVVDLIKGPFSEIKISDDSSLLIQYFLTRTNNSGKSKVKINSENTEYKWITPKESLNFEYASTKNEVIRILTFFHLL